MSTVRTAQNNHNAAGPGSKGDLMRIGILTLLARTWIVLTGTLPNGRRRTPAHAKLECYVAQIVHTYRGAECY